MSEPKQYSTWIRRDENERYRPFSGGHVSPEEAKAYIGEHCCENREAIVVVSGENPNRLAVVKE